MAPISADELKRLMLVVFDFDGVFTDNKVYVSQDGTESVRCDRGDALGLRRLREGGVAMLILSTEANPVVAARGKKLGLPVAQNCADKREWLRQRLVEEGMDPATVAFVGNDMNDLPAMELAGLAVCPADAHPAVAARARWVLSRRGGEGAVREFCEIVADAREAVPNV